MIDCWKLSICCVQFSSVITEEVHYTFFNVLDYSMLHNVDLSWLGSTHLKNTRELRPTLLVLLDQVHVRLLDYLDGVAEDFDSALHPRD